MGKFLLLGSFAVNGNKKAPTAYSSAQELNLRALNLHLEKLILSLNLKGTVRVQPCLGQGSKRFHLL